jgi:hypothetical protein
MISTLPAAQPVEVVNKVQRVGIEAHLKNPGTSPVPSCAASEHDRRRVHPERRATPTPAPTPKPPAAAETPK